MESLMFFRLVDVLFSDSSAFVSSTRLWGIIAAVESVTEGLPFWDGEAAPADERAEIGGNLGEWGDWCPWSGCVGCSWSGISSRLGETRLFEKLFFPQKLCHRFSYPPLLNRPIMLLPPPPAFICWCCCSPTESSWWICRGGILSCW